MNKMISIQTVNDDKANQLALYATQKLAFQNAELNHHGFFFAHDKENCTTGAKMYGSCKDYEEFLSMYDNLADNVPKNFYELLYSENPTCEYYDIDLVLSDEMYGKTPESVFRNFCIVHSNFVNQYEGVYNTNKWRVTDSSKLGKISLHIVNRSRFFANQSEVAKWYKDFEEFCKIHESDGDIFDTSVSSKNRCMRMIGSSKAGQNRPLKPAQWHEDSRDAPMSDFLIQNVDRNELLNQITKRKERQDKIQSETKSYDKIVKEMIKEQDQIPEMETITEGDCKAETLICLISEMVVQGKHPLCDGEIKTALNYAKFRDLSFAFLSCKAEYGDDDHAFKSMYTFWITDIWTLYRHHDSAGMNPDNVWGCFTRSTCDDGFTEKSLHYWARENPKYRDLFKRSTQNVSGYDERYAFSHLFREYPHPNYYPVLSHMYDVQKYFGMDFNCELDEKVAQHMFEYLKESKEVFYYKDTEKIYCWNPDLALFAVQKPKFLGTYLPKIFAPIVAPKMILLITNMGGEYGVNNKEAQQNIKNEKIRYLKMYEKFYKDIHKTSYQKNIVEQVINFFDGDENQTKFIQTTFDRQKHLFPIKDKKVIDLSTGEIRQREKTDYFTKTSDNVFIEDYDRNFVMTYIKEILNIDTKKAELDKIDSDFIRDILLFMGYCLTGDNHLRSFMVFVGAGSNGKTVFLKLLKKIYQTFTVTANKRVFVQSKTESVHNEEIFPLVGSRVAYISELEKGQKFNETLIKEITGNDENISARRCGKEMVGDGNVIIDCKLLLATNEMPQFSSEAFANRLLICPFSNVFTKNEKRVQEIYSMKDHFFSCFVEYSKIFFDQYMDKDIVWCDRIMDATKECITDADPVRQFIDERYEITTNDFNRVNRIELYQEYIQFCEIDNCIRVGKKDFYAKVIKIGDGKIRVYRDREFAGLKAKSTVVINDTKE